MLHGRETRTSIIEIHMYTKVLVTYIHIASDNIYMPPTSSSSSSSSSSGYMINRKRKKREGKGVYNALMQMDEVWNRYKSINACV